jgi:hypothetical protein
MALRPRKKQKKDRPRPAATPAEELKSAFQQLRDQRDRRVRKGKTGKQRHIDDYRELVLDGTKPGEFSQALLEVTARSYADRKRLLADEPKRTELKQKGSGPAPSAKQVQAEAEREARKLKKAMAKKGVPEREHYYPAADRFDAGEIDRTYDVETE